MEEELFLAFYNETSKRHTVLEDDGLTSWLYLSQPSDDPAKTEPIDSYCFVYNRKEPMGKGSITNCNILCRREIQETLSSAAIPLLDTPYS